MKTSERRVGIVKAALVNNGKKNQDTNMQQNKSQIVYKNSRVVSMSFPLHFTFVCVLHLAKKKEKNIMRTLVRERTNERMNVFLLLLLHAVQTDIEWKWIGTRLLIYSSEFSRFVSQDRVKELDLK